MSQSICLVMVVKDEAASVGTCLASALPLIDSWRIVDTGSTDGTPELIQAALAGIPGRCYKRRFVDFRHNRTQLLDLGRQSGAEYVLMLDGDMELEQTAPLPELVADEYMLTVEYGDLEYALPLLTRASKPFRYKGVAHSYLCCDEPTTIADLAELRIVHKAAGGRRNGKIERDRDLLAAEVGRNPTDARSWFYLAQSYKDLGQVDQAISAYRMRASMNGWVEERYMALYHLGVLLSENYDAREGLACLLEAWKLRPHRAEALRAMANVADNVADKIPYPATDRLLIHKSAYVDSYVKA